MMAAVGAIVAVLLAGFGVRELVRLGASGRGRPVSPARPIDRVPCGGSSSKPVDLERARWEAYGRDVKGGG